MIIEFSVKNFRSIKDLQTISFVATKLDSNREEYPDIDKNNIVEVGNIRLLKTIGIYGANASGKSNVLMAMGCFSKAIRSLPSPESTLSDIIDPFLYQTDVEQSESFFQIIFLHEEKKYRYGFTIKKNKEVKNQDDSTEIITSEWLYGQKAKNMVKLFTRTGLKVDKQGLPNAKEIPDLAFKHSLFLTHAASFRKGICFKIRDPMTIAPITNLSYQNSFRKLSINFIHTRKNSLLDFLKKFQLQYHDIIVDTNEDEIKSDKIPKNKILLIKTFHQEGRQKATLNLEYNESAGTQKLFDLIGLLILTFDAIDYSPTIIIDELDSNFHPFLVIKLIELFNDPKINKSNAQLIFTTHDTNLLSPAIMRRDQFYFTEKDQEEATRLYSLADLKGIRNDADFAKQYLAGYYGAVPILEDFHTLNATEDE